MPSAFHLRVASYALWRWWRSGLPTPGRCLDTGHARLMNLAHHSSITGRNFVPGEPVDAVVELDDIAHSLAGHRIGLSLSSTYWPIASLAGTGDPCDRPAIPVCASTRPPRPEDAALRAFVLLGAGRGECAVVDHPVPAVHLRAASPGDPVGPDHGGLPALVLRPVNIQTSASGRPA